MKYRTYIVIPTCVVVMLHAEAQVNADGSLSDTAVRACLEIPKRTKQMQDVIDDQSSSKDKIQAAKNFLKSFEKIMSRIPQEKCEELRVKEQERLLAIGLMAQTDRPDAAIGMTREQVENETNWGKPMRKNVSTTRHETREQWIYSLGQYLFFENGKLVSIQQNR